MDRLAESAKILREATAIRERVGSDQTKNGLGTAWELAQTLAKTGETEESDRLYDKVLSHPDVLGAFNVALVRLDYAKLLRDAARFSDAEGQTQAAYDIRIDPKTANPRYATIAIDKMVTLYDMWNAAELGKGYDAKAAEWRAKF